MGDLLLDLESQLQVSPVLVFWLPLDHLLYTGSGAVAKKVVANAATNLVPTTLELGGKSPTIISSDADLKLAAKRIMFVKTLNAGQIVKFENS